MKRTLATIAAILACAIAIAAPKAVKQPEKMKALIIAGQDGSHWSEGAASCMQAILDGSGLFEAEILITPTWGEDISALNPSFKDYSVVVIDYGGVEWAEPVKKAFEQYVGEGGGVVFLHSSVIPMENWGEYNKMTALGAWNGRDEKWGPYVYIKDGKTVYDYSPGWAGHHGLQHKAVIDNIATEHPIMKGLPESWLHFKDEIYTKMRGPAQNMEILATTFDDGRGEPMMWTVRYGGGRVFVDLLGHCGSDPNMTYSMTCAGFQITFIRGCEWAASGNVTYNLVGDFPLKDQCTFRMDFKAPFNAR